MNSVIRIATHPNWYPESGPCSVDGFERRKGCRPGYGPEIVDFVLRYLQLPYEVVILQRNTYQGQLVDKNNSIFDGWMGDIQNGLYDTVVHPYTITAERYESFDFTTPIFPMESLFVVGPHQPALFESSVKVFTIFHPILTATFLVSLSVILIGLIVTNIQTKEHVTHRFSDILSKFETYVANASKQRLLTGKILILIFGAILVFFPKLYECCLLTFLLLPPDPVRMSERQLLEHVYRKQLTFVVEEKKYNTYGHWQIIRFGKDEKYRAFQEALSVNPPVFFNGELSTLVKIFNENPTKYVYFGDTDYADWLKGTASGCKLRSIKMDNPMIFWAGFIFRKNSTWVKILNEGINRNLPFIYAVNEQYFKENTTCEYKKTRVIPLELLTLLGCFTLLLIGYAASLLYLVVELFRRGATNGTRENTLVIWVRYACECVMAQDRE